MLDFILLVLWTGFICGLCEYIYDKSAKSKVAKAYREGYMRGAEIKEVADCTSKYL